MSDALGPEGSYYETKKREEEAKRRNRSEASYPITVTILYLVLGSVFDLWHPGWLIFLTIPLHYMRFPSMKARFCNPVFIALLYLVLGIFFDLWHPGWLIFLLIPLGEARGWSR